MKSEEEVLNDSFFMRGLFENQYRIRLTKDKTYYLIQKRHIFFPFWITMNHVEFDTYPKALTFIYQKFNWEDN